MSDAQIKQASLTAEEPDSEDKLLSIRQGDWQWNASVSGFINIVGVENVTFDEYGDVCVRQAILNDFAEKYFSYFWKAYSTTFSLKHIQIFKTTIDRHENNDFEEFGLNDLKVLNTYIREVKKQLKSNSYARAFTQMKAGQELLELEKKLATIREPKDAVAFTAKRSSLIPEVQESFPHLKRVIEICTEKEAVREIGARNAIYNIINKGWGGVSSLYQTPPDDVYADYNDYFVAPALKDLTSDHSKDKFKCFVCGTPMRRLDNGLTFLVATGFDLMKKTSHVWNHTNDVAICPLCKLIYSCLPAGISYAYSNGIYLNVAGLDQAQRVNYHLGRELLANEQKSPSVYRAVMQALRKQTSEDLQYDMADVQVVRYEKSGKSGDDGKYRFNILSRRILDVTTDSTRLLENLTKVYFTENGGKSNEIKYQVYDEVVNRILESRNLFTLLHQILVSTLNTENIHNFRSSNALQLLQVNQRLLSTLGGLPDMSKKMVLSDERQVVTPDEFVRSAQNAGYRLRGEYEGRDSENKLPGICYRLLNALKTGNCNMFLDVALNCYLYVGKTVPAVFTQAIGKDEEFSTMGYAFVSGLIMSRDRDSKDTSTSSGGDKIEAETKED